MSDSRVSSIQIDVIPTDSTTGFRGGVQFIAESIEDKIVIWGGFEGGRPRPVDLIYIFDVAKNTWTEEKATGDIHPG